MIICLSGFVIAGSSPLPGPGAGTFSPHHHQLLQQFGPGPLVARSGKGLGAAQCSSSSESVSSPSASPPPRSWRGASRVRTLYACLGESEGELSFEPNQIITNVTVSGEPGWLRGSLDGKCGLVPENYVEPLP